MNLNKILFSLVIIFTSNIIYSRTITPTYSMTQIKQVFGREAPNIKIRTRQEKGSFPGKYIFSCYSNYGEKLDSDFNFLGHYEVDVTWCRQILPCKTGSGFIVLLSTVVEYGKSNTSWDIYTVLNILDKNGNFKTTLSLNSNVLPQDILEIGEDIVAFITLDLSNVFSLFICDLKTNYIYQNTLHNKLSNPNTFILKSKDNNFIVGYSNVLELWSATGGMLKRKKLDSEDNYQISSIKKLDNFLAVSFTDSGKIRTFDIGSFDELAEFSDLQVSKIFNLFKSKDNQTLIAVYGHPDPNTPGPLISGLTFFILDVKTRAIIKSFEIDYVDRVRFRGAIVPGQHYFVCCDYTAQVYLIDFNGNLLAYAKAPRSFPTSGAAIKFLSDDTFCVAIAQCMTLFKINNLNNPKNNLLIRK